MNTENCQATGCAVTPHPFSPGRGELTKTVNKSPILFICLSILPLHGGNCQTRAHSKHYHKLTHLQQKQDRKRPPTSSSSIQKLVPLVLQRRVLWRRPSRMATAARLMHKPRPPVTRRRVRKEAAIEGWQRLVAVIPDHPAD
jgi:hypothetical protein